MFGTSNYQELYFALRNLKEHAEDTLIKMNWLKDLFSELMEMMFEMILDKEDISNITKEHLPNKSCDKFVQVSAFSVSRISFDSTTLALTFLIHSQISCGSQSATKKDFQ